MKNKEVYNWFGDFFEKRGFKIHGRYIIKTNNSSVFAFSFECTNTNSVYFRYAYFPLFIPEDHFHYAYGGRLEQIVSGNTSLCMPYETDVSINKWVDLVKKTVDCRILPFFSKISNPYNLQSMLIHKFPEEFKGSVLSKYKLLIYLCVMLGNPPRDLTFLVNKAFYEINKSQISDSIKYKFEADINALISITFINEEKRIEYFRTIIDSTKKMVFGL